jgi:hypothetical protein
MGYLMSLVDAQVVVWCGVGVLVIYFLCALGATARHTARRQAEIKRVGKTLPDIEFNGTVIHPVRKSDADLDVIWTVREKADG